LKYSRRPGKTLTKTAFWTKILDKIIDFGQTKAGILDKILDKVIDFGQTKTGILDNIIVGSL